MPDGSAEKQDAAFTSIDATSLNASSSHSALFYAAETNATEIDCSLLSEMPCGESARTGIVRALRHAFDARRRATRDAL